MHGPGPPSNTQHTHVATPLIPKHWAAALRDYPNKAQAARVISTIHTGADIAFNDEHTRHERFSCPNLTSAMDAPEVIDKWLLDECAAGRTAGPFDAPPDGIVVSPVGLVPKKPSGHRMIHHLSWPRSRPVESINGNTDSLDLTLTTFDHAIDTIAVTGAGTLLSKIDIQAAYRCIPVRQQDQPLLGIKWKDKWYYDKVLPFGLSSSCARWDDFASCAKWIITNVIGVTHVYHYVDDYLVIHGRITPRAALGVRDLIVRVMSWLGLPISTKKLEGPATVITYLGIEIDTVKMEARLPHAKLLELKALCAQWLTKSTCTTEELQSIIGKLNHAAKVVRSGRLFITRLWALLHATSHVKRPFRVGTEYRKDFAWWSEYLATWNGISIAFSPWVNDTELHLYTDASTIGCGGMFGPRWFAHQWSQHDTDEANEDTVKRESIPFFELKAIALAISTWREQLRGKQVVIRCDCKPVVLATNKASSRRPNLNKLLRIITYITATHNIHYKLIHIAGKSNDGADLLSRGRIQDFLRSHVHCNRLASQVTPLPTVTW